MAWTFGDEGTFDAIARDMVILSRSDESGALLSAVGSPYKEIFPQGILGQ